MKHLYVVRYGLSIMNQQGLLAGSSDTPLTDEGVQQAHIAAAKAEAYSIELIVTSPLSRAKHTAEIIAEELKIPAEKIVVDARATERDFGDMEGAIWRLGLSFAENHTVESREAVLERARSLKEMLDHRPEESILLVSHGSFIRAIRSLYQSNEPYADATAGTIPNGEIIQII